MRKAVLMILLACVSSSAAADWVYAARDSAGTTYYIDPTTFHRAGAASKMWHLIDYKEIQAQHRVKPFISTTMNMEYDCQQQRVRSLFLSHHAGNMAGGEMVYLSSDPGSWGPVPPGSVEEFLWKIACGKQ